MGLSNMRYEQSGQKSGWWVVSWDATGERWGATVATYADFTEKGVGNNGTSGSTLYITLPDLDLDKIEVIRRELEELNAQLNRIRTYLELKAVLS